MPSQNTKQKLKHKRICIVCNQPFEKAELLKLTLHKDILMLDLKQIIPGRSVYIYPGQNCLAKISRMQKKLFNRLKLKNKVKINKENIIPELMSLLNNLDSLLACPLNKQEEF